MKQFFLVITFFISFYLQAQSLVGRYGDHFGQTLILKQDSSFEFIWHLDLEASWSKGTWKLHNDTVLLTTVLLYDTLRTVALTGEKYDSLVVSKDQNAEVLTTLNPGYITTGWQNRVPAPNKLYFKRDRLYHVNESGILDKKKRQEFWTKKMYPSCFKKVASF